MENKKRQGLVKQYTKLLEQRKELEVFWRDAYSYTDPKRGMGFINSNNNDANTNAVNAKNHQAKNLDSTALESVTLLASTMYTGLTPKHSQWFNLTADKGANENDVPRDVKLYLEHTAQIVFDAIHSTSNYDAIAFDYFRDIAIAGMSGLYVELREGDLYFEQWPLDTMLCQSSISKERIDTVYRAFKLTVKEAVYKFGLNKVPDQIKDLYKDDNDCNKQFDFIHTIKPRINNKGKQAKGKFAKNMPFESTYVCKKSGTIVKESGFKYFPVVIPRWSLLKDSDYAVGQIDNAMPDIKMLNKILTLQIEAAEIAIYPPLVAKDDGVVNPNTVRIGAKRIIPVADTGNLKPLQSGANFNIAENNIARLQNQIKRVMMADVLSPLDKQNMTATEVRSRTQLMRQLTGPTYNRLQAEFLQPLIQLVFNMLHDAKLLPQQPESAGGRPIKPVFQSQQARVQRMEEIDSMNDFEQQDMASMVQFNPSVADMYDFDAAAKHKATLRGVPTAVVRDEQAIKKLREQRAAKQQQEAQQNAQQGGE